KHLPLPANHVGSPCDTRSFASGSARQIFLSRSRISFVFPVLIGVLTILGLGLVFFAAMRCSSGSRVVGGVPRAVLPSERVSVGRRPSTRVPTPRHVAPMPR